MCEKNEDSAFIIVECGMFVVVDGMGGYNSGEVVL